MKPKTTLLLLLSLTVLSVTGCKSLLQSPAAQKVDSALFTPTAWVTNYVAPTNVVYVTNQVTIVHHTNDAGQVSTATNTVPVNVTVNIPGHDDVKPVAWAPNATTTATIQGVTGLVPGYGNLIGYGITAGLGLLAAIRSKNYKAALVSVAQGVEHFTNNAPPDQVKLLKSTLNAVQQDHGTLATVNAVLANDVETRPTV